MTANIEQLRRQLGLGVAPLVTQNLEATAKFFYGSLDASPFTWLPYLRGIDFHKPVEETLLAPGRELVRHLPDSSSVKPFMYFTNRGESMMRTGTNFDSATFERFVLIRPIRALVSVASSISFDYKDRTSRPGGAVQYIIATRDFCSLQRQRF